LDAIIVKKKKDRNKNRVETDGKNLSRWLFFGECHGFTKDKLNAEDVKRGLKKGQGWLLGKGNISNQPFFLR